jgi:phosphoribosyl-dephospho-CoA transferase
MRQDAAVSLQGVSTIGTNERAQRLERLLNNKQGQLINETLNPPSYLKKNDNRQKE